MNKGNVMSHKNSVAFKMEQSPGLMQQHPRFIPDILILNFKKFQTPNRLKLLPRLGLN